MAEFVQTMKDWQRMCDTIKSCDDCPMQKEDGWTYVLCSEGGILSSRPEVAEKVIAKWVEEHPEPVYPTWVDWLVRVGVLGCKTSRGHEYHFVENAMFKPIPADIAQMLGIEPVPIVHGDCGATSKRAAMEKLGIEPKEG